jgi:hypothetical protein
LLFCYWSNFAHLIHPHIAKDPIADKITPARYSSAAKEFGALNSLGNKNDIEDKNKKCNAIILSSFIFYPVVSDQGMI